MLVESLAALFGHVAGLHGDAVGFEQFDHPLACRFLCCWVLQLMHVLYDGSLEQATVDAEAGVQEAYSPIGWFQVVVQGLSEYNTCACVGVCAFV